jgi:hypothetical protein
MEDTLKRKINLLIHLANADGHFDIKERAFIYNVCLRHGIAVDTIGDLIEHPQELSIHANLPEEVRIDYLTDCLLLILVDGKLLPKEINFCYSIGVQLGFTKPVLDKLIELVHNQPAITSTILHEHILKLAQPSFQPKA